MKRTPAFSSLWSKPALAATVYLAVALLTVPGRAQQPVLVPGGPPSQRPFGEDTHVFRRLLFGLHHEPIQPGELLPSRSNTIVVKPLDPKNVILIVLGDVPQVQAPSGNVSSRLQALPGGGLQGFLKKGGSVLLASDKPCPDDVNNDLNALVGCTINGEHFLYQGSADFDNCFHGDPSCPFLVPTAQGGDFFRNPDTLKPNLRVATNIPSVLSAGEREPRLPRGVLNLAGLTNLIPDHGPKEKPSSHTFMVGCELDGGGRLLVLADHSIFINYMMAPADNGNVEFATNCIDWLNAGKETRKRVLFLDDGRTRTDFDVPLSPDPMSELLNKAANEMLDKAGQKLDEIQEQANARLARAEQNDSFNHVLNNLLTDHGNLAWYHYLGIGFVLLTLVGLVAAFFRLVLHGFQQQSPIAPSLARLVDQQEPNQSLMEQRNQGMFQVGNLWEVGRQLARQTFAAAGFPANVGDRLPPVRANGGWWQRRRIRGKVTQLWALAFGIRPVPVKPAEWPALLRRLDWLRKSLASGSVRLG